MSAEGGPPRRLTFLGVNTQVVGWSLDGGRVLVASDWRRPFPWTSTSMPSPPKVANRICSRWARRGRSRSNAGGPGVVIGRNSRDPARWKRYRGGTTGTLWVDRQGDGEFEPLVRLEGNLANPMWVGRRIYFLSDHEGTGNLYSVTPTGRGLERHTDHEDFYARFPSTDGRRIVYHAGADLWRVRPGRGQHQAVGGPHPQRPPAACPSVHGSGTPPGDDRPPPQGSLCGAGRAAERPSPIPLWEGAPVATWRRRRRSASVSPPGCPTVSGLSRSATRAVRRRSSCGAPTAPLRHGVIKGDIGRADRHGGGTDRGATGWR